MKRSSLSKVGAISHVSCIDCRRISGAGGAAAGLPCRQLTEFGLAQLENLCALFGAQPVRVMARCAEATLRCVRARGQSPDWNISACSVQAIDSRACGWKARAGLLPGAILWWRKRGWPKFLPWRLQLRSQWNAGEAQDSALRAERYFARANKARWWSLPADAPAKSGRVVVIGLDMGDGALIQHWASVGILPNFRRLLREGSWYRA